MSPRPPRLAEALLRLLLPRERRDEVLGDLAEAWARRRARSRFGAAAWYAAQAVAVPVWLAAETVASTSWGAGDARRSLRTLWRTPRFTAAAVASLALGIGATTTIAGAADTILARPLPVERPDELALVYHSWPDRWEGGQYGSSQAVDPTDGLRLASNVSYPAFRALDEAASDAIQLAAYAFVRGMAVVDGDRPAVAAGGMVVSGDYFAALRVRAALGRTLTPDDDRAGAPPVAVLAHDFWRRTFAGDSAVVGRTLDLNGRPFQVVGVAQPGYAGLSPGGFFGPSDVILPLAAAEWVLPLTLDPSGPGLQGAGDLHWVRLIARVPPDVAVAPLAESLGGELRAALVAHGIVTAAAAPDVHVRFLEGRRGLDSLRQGAEGPLRVLGVVVVFVLLIACGNLATLLLARGASRRGELAVRRAVGAGRWDLARPLLVESLILAGAGALVGIALATQVGPAVTTALTGGASSSLAFRVDGRLLGAAALAALVAAVASSLPPAVRAMRVDPGNEVGARGGGSGFPAAGRGLIVLQIALSMPLVVGAALFLRTLGNLAQVDPGFDSEGLVVFRVDPSFVTRDADEQTQLYGRVLDALRAAPGLGAASAVENALLSGWQSDTDVEIDGVAHHMMMNAVGPGFFDLVGVPLRSGRELGAADRGGAPDVVVVNETANRRLFGGSAVGRRFRVGERDVEVVGVVGDTRYRSLRDEVEPTFHDPWDQRPDGIFTLHFVVRPTLPAGEAEAAIRDVVAGVDPGMPVMALRTSSDDIARGSTRERLFARLLSAFGLFALLLAGIGLHGVTAFAVARRTGEIGVRLALGAAPLSIVGMVLRQILVLAGLGLALGLVGAWALGPVVRSMLFEVAPSDPATLVLAALVMVGATLASAWWPARRAARLDPRTALAPEHG